MERKSIMKSRQFLSFKYQQDEVDNKQSTFVKSVQKKIAMELGSVTGSMTYLNKQGNLLGAGGVPMRITMQSVA